MPCQMDGGERGWHQLTGTQQLHDKPRLQDSLEPFPKSWATLLSSLHIWQESNALFIKKQIYSKTRLQVKLQRYQCGNFAQRCCIWGAGGTFGEKKKCFFKSILVFRAIQIKGNMRFERALVTSAAGSDCFFASKCYSVICTCTAKASQVMPR